MGHCSTLMPRGFKMFSSALARSRMSELTNISTFFGFVVSSNMGVMLGIGWADTRMR
jgi:hypothetical protein